MNAYLTPGVYRRPPPSDKSAIALVRTDVAGFVGYAERGPLPPFGSPLNRPVDLAVKLESWAEYQRVFGGLISTGYLAYAVRAFFANGGQRCYVVRVAAGSDPNLHSQDRPAAASLPLPKAGGEGHAIGLLVGKTLNPGDSTLTLTDASGISPGDLVGVVREGFRFFSTVVDVARDNTIQLAMPLPRTFTPDSAHPVSVIRYAPAVVFKAISPVVVDGIPWAESPGQWGNRIRLDVTPLSPGSQAQEFSLRVTLEPGLDTSVDSIEEFYRLVSLHPKSPYFAPGVINGISRLVVVTIPEGERDGSALDLQDGPLAEPSSQPGAHRQHPACPHGTFRRLSRPSLGQTAGRSRRPPGRKARGLHWRSR